MGADNVERNDAQTAGQVRPDRMGAAGSSQAPDSQGAAGSYGFGQTGSTYGTTYATGSQTATNPYGAPMGCVGYSSAQGWQDAAGQPYTAAQQPGAQTGQQPGVQAAPYTEYPAEHQPAGAVSGYRAVGGDAGYQPGEAPSGHQSTAASGYQQATARQAVDPQQAAAQQGGTQQSGTRQTADSQVPPNYYQAYPYRSTPYTDVPTGGTNTYQRTRDHVAAGLLAIFLGGLGIHKFYLGYNEAGLITLGISLLGSLVSFGFAGAIMSLIGLIEGIIYLTKNQTTFEQVYVYGKRDWF
jgi:TM2 domain-containing membrane protein YozV